MALVTRIRAWRARRRERQAERYVVRAGFRGEAMSYSRVDRLICRVLNSHKWQRVQTASEEAYQCRRCGKRYFGKLKDPDLGAFAGGGG
jgi:hypothetical protein